MANITINGSTLIEPFTERVPVYTSYDIWCVCYLTSCMHFNSVTETATSYVINYYCAFTLDGAYGRNTGNHFNHIGNGIWMRPAIKWWKDGTTEDGGSDTHYIFAEEYHTSWTASFADKVLYNNHTFTIPKQSYPINIRALIHQEGVFILTDGSAWNPNVALPSGYSYSYYPFFNSNNTQSDIGPSTVISPANSQALFYTTSNVVKGAAGSLPIYVYNSSKVPRNATAVYVYGSDSKPHLAKSVTVYDSAGKPHTINCS